jgi:hypothetical protein
MSNRDPGQLRTGVAPPVLGNMPPWGILIGLANCRTPVPGFREEDIMTVWERCEDMRHSFAHLESGRLRVINTPMGQELLAELHTFEVDFTSAGNMRVDVRSRDHYRDLVIATALALWSAVGRPSGRIEVGKLDGWFWYPAPIREQERPGSLPTPFAG